MQEHFLKSTRQFIPEIKLLFIHIPRTGGSFIEKNLYNLASSLQSVKTNKFSSHFALQSYPEEIQKYQSFTVVRNPCDRIYSFVKNFFSLPTSTPKENTLKKLNYPESISDLIGSLYDLHKSNKLLWQQNEEDSLIRSCEDSDYFFVHFTPQVFYCKASGNQNILNTIARKLRIKSDINVDFILKYEQLEFDFLKMLNNLDINQEAHAFLMENIVNKVRSEKNINNFSEQDLQKIREIYQLDFKTFNYEY